MAKLSKQILLATFVFLLLTFSPSVKVFAQISATPSQQKLRNEIHNLRKDIRQEDKQQDKGASKSSEAKDKIKQNVCQNHAKNITKRAKNIADKADSMQKRLDAIVTAVEKYYTEKLVPQGKIVSNYATLVADVAAKKAVLTPLVTKVQTDATNFSCDSTDPKAEFKTFKADMQKLLLGFKDYRKSVRNLIVAVLNANGVTPSPTVMPSAAPTESL